MQISCQLDKYSPLYKNDKLLRFILAKIVQPIENCQATNFIFLLASLKLINTLQKFAWQYDTYFYPYEFPQKTSFIKRQIERSYSNQVYCKFCIFPSQSMSIQTQQNLNHKFFTYQAQVMQFSRQKSFKKHLISSILFTQKITRNCALHIFIKYYTS